MNIHVQISEKEPLLEDAMAYFKTFPYETSSFFISKPPLKNGEEFIIATTYEIYKELAVKTFQSIAKKAHKEWGEGGMAIFIEYFDGTLQSGKNNALIAVSTPTHTKTIQALQFIMEQINAQFLIWKQEHYMETSSEWTQGQALGNP